MLLYGAPLVTPRLPPTCLVCCLLALGASGCVTVYQPLVGLQRPLAVDPEIENLEGQRLLVRCVPSDALEPTEAEQLCRRMRSLFMNQGAAVETEVPRKNAGFATWGQAQAKPDLIIELRSRLLHEERNGWLLALCIASLGLWPSTSEFEFAQDVTIRDGSGFLLSTDSLQGRFIRWVGLTSWVLDAVLDLFVRPKDEALTGDGAQRQFSRDFYGQLSQLAFGARMRSAVMHEFEAAAPPAPAKAAPP